MVSAVGNAMVPCTCHVQDNWPALMNTCLMAGQFKPLAVAHQVQSHAAIPGLGSELQLELAVP